MKNNKSDKTNRATFSTGIMECWNTGIVTSGKLVVPLLLFFLLMVSHRAEAQNALEIVKKMDEKMTGKYSHQELTMTIIRPSWQRSVSLKSWALGTDYSMILVTAPAREKGQAFLKRNKEMWNWVPSINRMIKIPPSMMMQSWLGSDFTNDDLVRESSVVVDYTHKMAGEENIQDRKCWKIELTPKPEAAVVWGKVYLWVTQNDYLQLKAEFYDEYGGLVNTMNLSDIKEIGGRTLPTRWEMIPADEDGKSTVLVIEKADFTTPIQEDFFSQQNMKRLR